MKLEEVIANELAAVLEPALLMRVESDDVSQSFGIDSSSGSQESFSVWLDLISDSWRFLNGFVPPTDWQGWLSTLGELGGLLNRLHDAASGDVQQKVEKLLSVLVSYWLRYRAEPLFWALDILGMVRVEGTAAADSLYPRPVLLLDTDNLGTLVRRPDEYFRQLLRLDSSASVRGTFFVTFLVPKIARLLRSLGVPISVSETGNRLTVQLVLGETRASLGLSVGVDGSLGFVLDGAVRGNFTLGTWVIESELSPERGTLQLAKRAPHPTEWIFSAGVGGVGFALNGFSIVFGYQPASENDWWIEFALKRLSVGIGMAATDSFSAAISGGTQVAAVVDLAFKATSRGEFRVTGQGDAGARIQLGLRLGPITLRTLNLGLQVRDGQVQFGGAIDFDGSIGPLKVALTGIGLRSTISLASGDLGSVAFDFDAKPPDGVGISIDAGPVRGSGFITYDPALGRYSGALALSIGSIALRAIGILDTRAPGVSGYSFLIVISAEFSPIQLGFGFTLMGVGGLCGIQRSISVSALQSGVRDGSLAPLLFSRDPIAQAAQLITGLQRIFPPTNDRYVFGPMFKLGWGTPTLVTVDLGIVLQVPSPIVIVLLGTLSASLPRPEAAVVVINLDIVGVLEVTEKRLSISASLRDSRIAAFALTGDLELRFSWGADPEFLFSLGGFNPEFRPPPGFPTLRRLSLALGSGANPRLSLASYFAITSNTLQFGARAELHATAAGFTVQGYIEFHALIIFRPFSFRFDFAAGLSLKRGNSLLAAITVTGLLKGPRPWYIKATASITVLFFDVSVQIERTFGQAAEPELATPVDVWTRLLPALADVRNWSATLPEGRPRGVSTAADGETPPRVRLDPMSQLAVRQKVLPLDRRITKLGEAVIGPPARFEIRAVRVGATATGTAGTPLTARPVEEPFAAAQYQTLTDAEKLSRPSFEPMAAGVEALGNAVRAGGQQRAPVQWRTLRLEPSDRDASTPPGPVSATRAGKLGAVDAAKCAALRTTGMERFAPPEGKRPLVALAPEAWTLASKTDLRPREGVSPSKARGASDEVLREIPEGERSDWQVVPVRGGRG